MERFDIGDRVIYTGLASGKPMHGVVTSRWVQKMPNAPDSQGVLHYVVQLDDFSEPIDVYQGLERE